MSAWSSRRKSLYAFIIIIVVAVFIGIPAYSLLHQNPSCVDNTKNGDELGIDCGGSCSKLCSSAFLPIPSPSWVRFKEAAPHIYNIAAYVVNPNPKAEAKGMQYRFSVLDKDGIQIAESKGVFSLTAGRNILIFVNGLAVKDQLPARVILEYNKTPAWVPGKDVLTGLGITGKDYDETTTESSVDVTLTNRSSLPMRNIVVYAILKDKDNNVLDFSKTIVDEIAPAGTGLAPFTWPVSHNGQVISIEVLTVPE